MGNTTSINDGRQTLNILWSIFTPGTDQVHTLYYGQGKKLHINLQFLVDLYQNQFLPRAFS